LFALLLAGISGSLVVVALNRDPLQYARIKGTVSLEGKPLPFGSITFFSPDYGSLDAQIVDGEYEIKAFRRHHVWKVLVTTSEAAVKAKQQDLHRRGKSLLDEGKRRRDIDTRTIDEIDEELARRKQQFAALQREYKLCQYVRIPSRYERADSSPFSVTTRKEVQRLDLQLDDE
jgi:hypothetical protein